MAWCGIMIMAFAVTHGRGEHGSISACGVVH
jgi:hypothetical protein